MISRLNACEMGNVDMLVQMIVCAMEARLTKIQDAKSPEQRASVFQMKRLKCDLRGAFKYLTESDKG
jgi:hypothetical protein